MTTRSEEATAGDPIPPERKRRAREIAEREIAMALVLELAESGLTWFSLLGFYDDDAEFIFDLERRLNVIGDKAFHNKLTRVVRKLVNYGVLCAVMRGTHKEYIDEPAKQMEYGFTNPGKANLIRQERRPGITMGPEGEAAFLLRRAYPEPDWL